MSIFDDLVSTVCKCGCGKTFKVSNKKDHYFSKLHAGTLEDRKLIKARGSPTKMKQAHIDWKLRLEFAEKMNKW